MRAGLPTGRRGRTTARTLEPAGRARKPVPDDAAVPAASRPRVPWQLRFAVLSLVWGSSFVLIKYALRGFAPLQVSFGRIVLGTAVLAIVLAARREGLPRSLRTWGHLLVSGFFMNALPFTLFSWSETRVPSLVAGIYNAAAPLVTLAVASLLLPDERPTPRRVAGFSAGLLGVLVVLGVWDAPSAPLSGQLAALAATVSYGLGYPYVRRFLPTGQLPVAVLATAQLGCAALWLAPVAPRTVDDVPLEALLALLSLGVIGTGFAYLLLHGLIRERGATTTSLINYPIPIVAVLLGVLLLGEPVAWNQPVGALVVLAGVALAEGRMPLRRSP